MATMPTPTVPPEHAGPPPKAGCSVLVVAMIAALMFVVGMMLGAGTLYGYLSASPDNIETLGMKLPPGEVVEKVVTKEVAAECPPCQRKGSETAYGVVYPIEESLRVEGSIDLPYFKDLMRKERFSFQKCYQKALAQDPNAKGELALQFTISSSTGKVIATAERQNTLNNKAVSGCIFDRIKQFNFKGKVGAKRAVHVIKFDLLFLPISGAP